MVLALYAIVRYQGHVTGEEFSPTHFQQRTFAFYEIPLIHVQITPIRRTGSTTETARYLRHESLIQSKPGPPQLWHLVHLDRGMIRSTPADAQLLVTQLSLRPQGGLYWKSWSEQHPDRARVFWPVIQRLAVRELYVLVPTLFEIAQQDLGPQELQQTIDRYLRREYRKLIREMQAADRHELADQLLQEASEDFPDAPDWEQLATPHET